MMCGLVFVWFWACVTLRGWTVWFAVQILCALARYGLVLSPYATLAQLVERSFRKAQVASSSLAGGFFRIGHFRKQKRLMESRMSSAGLDQRNGVGESLGLGRMVESPGVHEVLPIGLCWSCQWLGLLGQWWSGHRMG